MASPTGISAAQSSLFMSTLAFLLLCSLTAAQDSRITKYSSFVDESELGTSFGVILMTSSGEEVKKVKMAPGDNTTVIAMNTVGPDNENYKTIDVLLAEAAGGRCDACRTTTEVLVSTMLTLVKNQGKIKRGAAVREGDTFKISVDPEAATKAVNKMCTDARFLTFAPHVMKGCVEFLAHNGTEMVQKLNDALSGEKFVNLTNDICADMLGVCRPRPQMVLGTCRKCAEVVSLFDYKLRRANPVNLDSHNDAMSLTKPKARDDSYMSRLFVQSRLDSLCGTTQHTLLVRDSTGTAIDDACDDLVSEHEEDFLRLFTKKKPLMDVGKEMCVDIAEACTEEEYNDIQPSLYSASHIVAFGPMDISITPQKTKASSPRLSPREKAMHLASQDNTKGKVTKPAPTTATTKKTTVSTEKPSKSTKPAEGTSDENEIEGIQDFLDEMESQGELTQEQSEALLRKAFNADKPLLRCFRINKSKGPSKLLARMKLLLPAEVGQDSKATKGTGVPGLTAERMEALTEKMRKVHKGQGNTAEEVNKLGDTLGQLKQQMQAQGMDTESLDKLDSVLSSTKKMAESHKSAAKDDTITAAEQAAEAAMEATKAMHGSKDAIPNPDEL